MPGKKIKSDSKAEGNVPRDRIPVCEPLIDKRELEYVTECLETGWVSSAGRFLPRFEQAFSRYVGKKHGISVSNGTSALILALRALDLEAGSEVIIPTFTIISCALACIYNQLVPVFVDADMDTWTMNVEQVEARMTAKTRAIMVVHIYGHPVDMDPITALAKRYDLQIIEDFAEAIGSEYRGVRCGRSGIISCCSFYANKVITTGEGGMCLTDDGTLADRMRALRNLCFVPNKRFIHQELGFNFRMTNIQAALGLAQIERIEDIVKKKIWIGETYKTLLKALEGRDLIRLPVQRIWARNSYWMFGVLINKGVGLSAESARQKLADRGIQTRPFFYPLHKQPAFHKYPWFKAEIFKVSETLYQYGFYLPSGLTLREDQLARVAAGLRELF